jgi:hypothetical protein
MLPRIQPVAMFRPGQTQCISCLIVKSVRSYTKQETLNSFQSFLRNFYRATLRPVSHWGNATAIRSRKKWTTLNSWRVVIASWSHWWEKRHCKLKVRTVGDYKVIFSLIESQSRRLSGRPAFVSFFRHSPSSCLSLSLPSSLPVSPFISLSLFPFLCLSLNSFFLSFFIQFLSHFYLSDHLPLFQPFLSLSLPSLLYVFYLVVRHKMFHKSVHTQY